MQTKRHSAADKIIIALDFADCKQALALAATLRGSGVAVKIGNELFTRGGCEFVRQLQQYQFRIFLDLKFYDIPNTVAGAVKAAAALGVWMVNVHALGGAQMMRAARAALNDCQRAPLLIAVTMLTSVDERQLPQIGIANDVATQVELLAALAIDCGMDGIVCSGHEVAAFKARYRQALAVTPGIRSAAVTNDDQKRVMLPSAALAAGSDYLVIGRDVTRASDPLLKLRQIINQCESENAR